MCSSFFPLGSCVIGVDLFQVKKLLKDGNEPLQVHERLLAGSTAGVIAQTTIYPLEVLSALLLSM